MKLFDIANKYCKESDWITLAAVKFCLFSLGMIVGVLLPDACRVYVVAICTFVFLVTYIPLMLKLIRLLRKK